MPEEQRFVLGIAYQAGPDPRITRGLDGGRDWFSKEELELACWSYMRSGCPQMNAFHVDGTEDCAEPVESFIWRWDDWDVGDGIVVKNGDWCLGAILSPRMWKLHKEGKVNGLSPEGTAIRRQVQKGSAMTIAKGSAAMADDDDEFTELVNANIPKVALVGQGANGIPRFLISKQADDTSRGLMDPAFVRDLIGKQADAEPAPAAEQVTVTGSPAAIAKMIHQAAQRAATAGDVAKAELGSAKQNDLPDSDFAYIEPGGHNDDQGKTVPRSLRHFPINDEAHVRNALARAPQSPFGDKAMPKIRAAAKKFGIEVSKMIGGDPDESVDGLDPTVVLAAPDDDAPGDPNTPGSPAWEAIDAATAQKWTSIAVRLKNALAVMAERELLEAASADPGDADDAWDLQDAQCALDYVIDTLASFAVGELAAAELGGEAMTQVGKALASFDPAALDTVEALGQVAKAGRVLSAQNEQAIRTAAEHLQKVLASLPSAPEVIKTAHEEPTMPTPSPSEDRTAAAGEEPAMGTAEVEKTAAEAAPVVKADGEKPAVVVVYDQKGRLIGIVDPSDVTPVANAEAEPDDMDGTDGDGDGSDGGDGGADGDGSSDDDGTDLTPQPPADAGTPANAPTTDDDGKPVAKTTHPTDDTAFTDMFKSSLQAAVEDALTKHSATQAEQIAKTGDAVLELAGLVETLKGRVRVLEEQPAAPKVFSNGAVPPREQMRGQDHGAAAAVDVTKAAELKRTLYRGTAIEQNQAAIDMQTGAIAALSAIHQQQQQR